MTIFLSNKPFSNEFWADFKRSDLNSMYFSHLLPVLIWGKLHKLPEVYISCFDKE